MKDNIVKKILQPSDRGKVWRLFVFIIILSIAGLIIDAPVQYNKTTNWIANKTGNSIKLPKVSENPFHLGLDLQGGSHLVYKADMSKISDRDKSEALEGVRDVIERRVNVFGVSEPIIQTNISGGEHRIIVELAGIKDINEAIKMIGETPLLEFKEEGTEERELNDEEKNIMQEYNKKAEEKAEELLGKLVSGGDFAELAKEYSQDEKTKDNGGDSGWITKKDNPYFVSKIENFKKGEFTKELFKGPKGYEFFKLEDKRDKINPFKENEVEKEIKASHLLLCFNGIEGCKNGLTRDQAYKKIKEIKAKATIKNFSELIKEYSTEPGAKDRAGDLGWFGKGDMVKPFEDAVFEQKIGTISYVVETKFGFHLIYKQEERNITEYKIRDIIIATMSKSDILGSQKNWKNTKLTGKNLKRATVQFNPNNGNPEVSLEFDKEGSDLFAKITEKNIGKQVAIFLDNYPISTPNVNEKITGGKAVISGNFNIKEAKLLAQRLNAGALPVPIKLISQQTVGASLGHSSLNDSLKAGLIGLLLVAIFMILYYRLSGFLAVISLSIYGIIVLAIFKIWPVTLSLSGMAGFILSIGMAVYSNFLVFERLKEELKEEKPFSMALEDAFSRAWPSIRDGNVSTLITCFILIQFSTSIVKGFAITLGLGVIVSMFSAIIVTKTLMKLGLRKNK